MCRVTVVQMSDDATSFERNWETLAQHTERERADVVLLPEMPFAPWAFAAKRLEEAAWDELVETTNTWLDRLSELAVPHVIGSRPVTVGGRRLNQAFAWSARGGLVAGHAKCYLPDEPEFWEASCYDPGPFEFRPTRIDSGLCIGFLICTEMWFPEAGRLYAAEGAHVIATPRATWASRHERWVIGGRALSLLTGCYSISSAKVDSRTIPDSLGGHGWISDPDGTLLALTADESPFATAEISLPVADAAKGTYPRYVRS